MSTYLLLAVFSVLSIVSCVGSFIRTASAAPAYAFEKLGRPVKSNPLPVSFATHHPDGDIAWVNVIDPERRALVGVKVQNGELITVGLEEFAGGVRNLIVKADENTIFIFSSNPGQFFRYEIAQNRLTSLGAVAPATYWMGHAVTPDKKFYVGAFPDTNLAMVDMTTGKAESFGSLSDDKRQQYVGIPAVGEDGVLYFPVGMHHKELWSFDSKTNIKRQILPAEMMSEYGMPSVWTGRDGRVYGKSGTVTFLCRPDSVQIGAGVEARPAATESTTGDFVAQEIDTDGNLVLIPQAGGEKRLVPTAFESVGTAIFSIGDQFGDKLYGGSQPSFVFSIDTKTGALEDLGKLTGGTIQVYDIAAHPKGLFLSSYVGSHFDFFDPTKPKGKGNPRSIAMLSKSHLQERPHQLINGPDGMIYSVTAPVKGHLGGALVRINPDTFEVKVWRNLIHNQSHSSLAAVPETGELFCNSTIGGGSSAIPTEKEGFVFLWDTKTEQITFRAQPVPGTTTYGAVVRAGNGLIYGLAGNKYYAFDPVRREVVFVGDLPVVNVGLRPSQSPKLSDKPVGPRGLIYGIAISEGVLFAIDPADHSARIVASDPSLLKAHAIAPGADGNIYYSSGADIMRCIPPH